MGQNKYGPDLKLSQNSAIIEVVKILAQNWSGWSEHLTSNENIVGNGRTEV